eukprot:CAMPEP_0197188290 /NCGR_PEP_ID=MMETSP1423-20130617/17556_1 /TAXON_ID=476441 /ORGANISM="Pseudo-nitzschia heimii, Strain UNC1101" /LENGTH=210 /DNA_ID=CAMNT_0042640089 /DNA_START=67 /DNA_END=695 /DNA_ORIENTATION=-
MRRCNHHTTEDPSPVVGEGRVTNKNPEPPLSRSTTVEKNRPIRAAPATLSRRSTTRSRSVHPVGTIVRKPCDDTGTYLEGEVVRGYNDDVRKRYEIRYLDGTKECYDEPEMKKRYKWLQKYSHEPYEAIRDLPVVGDGGPEPTAADGNPSIPVDETSRDERNRPIGGGRRSGGRSRTCDAAAGSGAGGAVVAAAAEEEGSGGRAADDDDA